jgi:hypothetical protein
MAKITIDFQILETKNPQLLMVSDNSVWEYAEDLSSWIVIVLPGSTTELKYTFKKESINQFNSHNLGISCLSANCDDEEYIDLPDGIYTICVKSAYTDIEKSRYYLKTDRFDVDLAKVIIKNGFEYNLEDKEFRDKIFDIKWYLLTAKSHALNGDFVKADNFFQDAKKKLRVFQDCKNCG